MLSAFTWSSVKTHLTFVPLPILLLQYCGHSVIVMLGTCETSDIIYNTGTCCNKLFCPSLLTTQRLSTERSQRNSCIPTIANKAIHSPSTKSTGRMAFAAVPALSNEKLYIEGSKNLRRKLLTTNAREEIYRVVSSSINLNCFSTRKVRTVRKRRRRRKMAPRIRDPKKSERNMRRSLFKSPQ